MNSRILYVTSILLAVLVVFAVHALDFPGSVPDFERSSGGGVLLDIKPSFSEEMTYQRLAGYGAEGRNNYFFRNLTVDIVLPLAVFPALFLSMWHALRRFSVGPAARALLFSLPFIYVAFDIIENAMVLALLGYFPDRMHLLAATLPYITVVKRSASLLALAIPVLIFGVSLIQKRPAKT